MFRNFLVTALRNLAKQKLFTSLNILGISMGIACCIVVYLLIQYQYSQDAFHQKASTIYMVNHVRSVDGSPERWAPSPDPLGPALKADLSEVKQFVRFQGQAAVVKSGANVFTEYVRLADPAFFKLFTFPLRAGSPDALTDPSGVVLSESIAHKYFGNEQPIGKSLTILFDDRIKRSFTVRAVAAPFPNTASFSFDMLVNYNVGKDLGWKPGDWARQVQATFIELDSPTSLDKVTKELSRYVATHNAINPQLVISSFYLDNLLTMAQHAHETRHPLSGGTSPTGLIVLGSLAGLVLLMACLNFMNYTIATSTTRFKEIGVRKTLGSTRQQLIRQFIGENLLTGFLALGLALILAETLFLPTFSRLIDYYQLRFNLFENWQLILFLLALLAGISLLAGLYPSVYISGFNPITVLKGKQRLSGTTGFVRILLVVQFGLSMFTVAAAIVTTQNAQYIHQMDVGYDQSQLMVLRANSEQSFNYLRDAARRLPEVAQVAGSQDQIGQTVDHPVVLEDNQVKSTAEVLHIGADYIRTLGLRVTQGRSFIPNSPTDADGSVLVNETLVRAMGWRSAVGKRIRVENQLYAVVGIVHDFNYRFFFLKIAPCVLKLNRPAENRVLTMKVNSADISRLSDRLKTEWQRVMPDVPFAISRQDDVYSASYDESRRVRDVFTYVALLTLVISVMGLFALVSLTIARKTKEIGIRKVLGASAFSISTLLNREFLILIFIAGCVFLPLAFVVLTSLFESEYIYHIPVTVGAFVSTLVMMLILALVTIGAQVYKIAIANPLKALRTE